MTMRSSVLPPWTWAIALRLHATHEKADRGNDVKGAPISLAPRLQPAPGMPGRIHTELRVAPEVLALLNELIRHEDREDHARALAQLVGELGGQPDAPQGADGAIISRYEDTLSCDLPTVVLDVLRRNLLEKRG